MDTQKNQVIRSILGDIVMSERPSDALRRWREFFGIKQKQLAGRMGVSPSVISDYELGRRRSPGADFLKKFVSEIVDYGHVEKTDLSAGYGKNEEIRSSVLDMREFLRPVKLNQVMKAVGGSIIANKNANPDVFGYTVIDSIKAILNLSDENLRRIYTASPNHVMVFTHVHTGRSPLVAIKLVSPKPNAIVLHGLSPNKIDKLALRIARAEKIPLAVSTLRSEKELIESLRKIA